MGEIITASRLFAPEKHKPGDHRCYFCGLDCDESHRTKDHVGPSFTNRADVFYPSSGYVCGCCVASTQGLSETTDISGETRTGRAGAPRMYSWVLTEKGNTAFNKKHLEFARQTVINPPDPPFSIILADSGQKQLIFRAPVNFDRNFFCVLLEDQRIEVEPEKIKIALEKALLVSAACGKKALSDPDKIGTYISCCDFWGDEQHLENWIEIHNTPAGKLAAWLCKGRDDARLDQFISGRIQKEIGVRVDQPTEIREQRKPEATGNQLLFNFAAPVQR